MSGPRCDGNADPNIPEDGDGSWEVACLELISLSSVK